MVALSGCLLLAESTVHCYGERYALTFLSGCLQLAKRTVHLDGGKYTLVLVGEARVKRLNHTSFSITAKAPKNCDVIDFL